MVDNFHDETVVHFRGVEVLEDDVMLVTFPKCGTTVRCSPLLPARWAPIALPAAWADRSS